MRGDACANYVDPGRALLSYNDRRMSTESGVPGKAVPDRRSINERETNEG